MSEFSFSKLFSSITKSTVWCEPHTTLRVWITMLADCDFHGRVYASIPGLANLARVTVEECESALETFLAPDQYSRTPDNEGRRIEVIEGGWRLLNYELYREKRDPEARKVQNREAQRRCRTRQHVSAEMLTKDDQTQKSAQDRRQKTETEKSESKSKEQVRSRGSRLPTGWTLPSDWRTWAEQERPDINVDREAASFADHWHAKAGAGGVKLDWEATWRNWIRRAFKPAVAGAASQGGGRRLSVSEQIEQHIRAGQHDAEPFPAIDGECWLLAHGGAA